MRYINSRLRPTQCLFYRPLPSAPAAQPAVQAEQPRTCGFRRRAPSRPFSSSTVRTSHIGKAPLTIPSSVSFNVFSLDSKATPKLGSQQQDTSPHVEIKGPLGELRMPIPDYITIKFDQEAKRAVVGVQDRTSKQQRAMWGTTRAYLANHILGVSEGHTTLLRLVGVGYRASIEDSATTTSAEFPGQKFVNLKVGYSHPIELGIPQGVTATTPQPTRILLEGMEKEVVNQFAARIRKWRVPEPYKGKGIFVNDQTIKLKAKKIK